MSDRIDELDEEDIERMQLSLVLLRLMQSNPKNAKYDIGKTCGKIDSLIAEWDRRRAARAAEEM